MISTLNSYCHRTEMQPPIFIIGALRSGTTVFRLMLDAHEEISNPSESDFIFDYLHWDSISDAWICDLTNLRIDRVFQSQNLTIPNSKDGKEIAWDFVRQLKRSARRYLCLCIHRNANKAAAIFPSSKVVHLVRDPRDVARSCMGMGWAGNTYFGVDQWIEAERNWNSAARFFERQNVIEMRFEELIAHPQTQLERVCNFIGVPYSPTMLDYSAHSTYAPPDPSAVEQWKSKLTSREVALVELKANGLLLQRNYQLSGYPLRPPSLGEKITLFWTNKVYKWRFACRRYGITNFLLEKIARRLAKPLHRRLAQQRNEIDKQYLK